MNTPLDEIISKATIKTLVSWNTRHPFSKIPSGKLFEDMKLELYNNIRDDIKLYNATSPKGEKLRLPTALPTWSIATWINQMGIVKLVICSDHVTSDEQGLLCIYQNYGPNAGTYSNSSTDLSRFIRIFNRDQTSHDIKEVVRILREIVPRVTPNRNPNLVPVNNGIFDYRTKTFEPFSHDKVFLSKCRVDYDSDALNVVIHNPEDGTDWNVDDWMNTLSDDPEIVNLLWEILSAVVRPYHPWNKCIFFYSTQGNNGKGTLCALMRNLCGSESVAVIPLADFGNEFALEPLTRSTAIIVDENDVGVYIDKAAKLKAVITGDTIQINRKYRDMVGYQFRGLMVQCVNELPRIKDRSSSLYRRLLIIPFEKCFTGHERKYIKEDYLKRKEVLEYVLYKVLNSNFDQLSEPKACKLLLDDYQIDGSSVRQFLDDILPEIMSDAVPFKFLHQVYVEWMKGTYPCTPCLGRNNFISQLIEAMQYYPEWTYLGRDAAHKYIRISSSHYPPKPEHLISDYNLERKIPCEYAPGGSFYTPRFKRNYAGIVRTSALQNIPAHTP